MGTIYHTGDIRFNPTMMIENTKIYPPHKRNAENHNIAIDIDELIYDNTYCDPVFIFPSKKEAFRLIR